MAVKPVLRFSAFRGIRIDGQCYAPIRRYYSGTNGDANGGIVGGSFTIDETYVPCSEAELRAFARNIPVIDFQGPVWIEDAVTSGGTPIASGGWLTTVRQEGVVADRVCKANVSYDEQGQETGRTEECFDKSGEASFWFNALGVKSGTRSGPCLNISGARPVTLAVGVADCISANVLPETAILLGTDTVVYAQKTIRLPRWDLSTTIYHSYDEGPFYSPHHRVYKANNIPFRFSGGGGGGGGDMDISVEKDYTYFKSCSFNLFQRLYMTEQPDALRGLTISVTRQ